MHLYCHNSGHFTMYNLHDVFIYIFVLYCMNTIFDLYSSNFSAHRNALSTLFPVLLNVFLYRCLSAPLAACLPKPSHDLKFNLFSSSGLGWGGGGSGPGLDRFLWQDTTTHTPPRPPRPPSAWVYREIKISPQYHTIDWPSGAMVLCWTSYLYVALKSSIHATGFWKIKICTFTQSSYNASRLRPYWSHFKQLNIINVTFW